MAETPRDILVPERPGGRDVFDDRRFDNIGVLRIVAYLIDAAIVGVLLLVAIAIGVVLTVLTLGLLGPLIGFLSFALVLVGYSTVLISGPRSATFGMRMVGIEVRRTDGGRPDFLLAAIHVIAFYVLHVASSFLLLLVGLFNARGRLLHDFLTGLVIVRAEGRP